MLIDFTTTINDFSSKPLKDDDDKLLTLATVAVTALVANTEEVNKLPGVQKVHRATLAESIYKCDEKTKHLDVPAEDVAMLKDAISLVYNPVVVMRAWRILDPKVKPVETDKAATSH